MHPDQRLLGICARIAGGAAVAAAAIGAVAMLGWILDVPVLREPFPGSPGTKANAALGLISLGVALWLVRSPETADEPRAWSLLICQLVILAAALTLIGWALDVEIASESFFTDPDQTNPGRDAEHVAIALIALAAWIAAAGRRGQGWDRAVGWLSGVACAIVLLAATAVLFGVRTDRWLASETGVSPTAVIALLLLSAGALCARPEAGWFGLLAGPGAGGRALRLLLPAILLIPIVAGAVLVIGVDEELFSLRAGTAVLCTAAIVALVAVATGTVGSLARSERERERLERRVHELADR